LLNLSLRANKDSLSKQVTSPIDSSNILLKVPDSLTEKKVFSDAKLQYNLNTKYEPGIFARFINWLSDLIFGDSNYDNIKLTREIIIWTVILASLGIIIWILSKSDLSRLIIPKSKITTFNFSELTEDLSSINFDKMIDEACASEEYRTAIRWHYLKSLYLLEKAKYLVFQPCKTNIDYQNDLKKTNLVKEFISISRIYDYVWYGKFLVTQTKYPTLKKDFISFENLLHVQGQ